MKIRVILLLLFLHSSVSLSQNSKKEVSNYYKQLRKIDTFEVMQGKHLELAKLFTIEVFISYYLQHGKEIDTKKYGTHYFTQLYKDPNFTYFGEIYPYGLLDFFKVATTDLANINLDQLNGNEIRARFMEEIVPKNDKEKVKRRKKQCSYQFTDNPQFSYQYKKTEDCILITLNWNITCDFFFKTLNKKYMASLDLNSNQLKNQSKQSSLESGK
jgi:hypothetical protein